MKRIKSALAVALAVVTVAVMLVGCSQTGAVFFGKTKDSLKEVKRVDGNYGVFVPAGTWHNIKNIGNTPLKLYSVYAPPHHTFGTVEKYG